MRRMNWRTAGMFLAVLTAVGQAGMSAGITMTHTSNLTTAEDHGSDYFLISADTPPTHDVWITVASSDHTEGRARPGGVVIPAHSTDPVTVWIDGVDDPYADGDIDYTIIVGPTFSLDPDYDDLDLVFLSVTNEDDEWLEIGVSNTWVLITTEAGGTDTFDVWLYSMPMDPVTIEISSSDLTEGSPSPTTLLFTQLNWKYSQTVTVTGIDDFLDDGDRSYSIVLSPAEGGSDYNGYDPPDVSVENLDDDEVGITVSSISGNTAEDGTTATFTVVLDCMPNDSVTMSLKALDATEGRIDVSSLMFTPGDWNVPQTVTVTGVDDSIIDGDITFTIEIGAAASNDCGYAGIDPDDVTAVNEDDDLTIVPMGEAGPGLLFLDEVLPLPEGEEPPKVGELVVSAAYGVDELITGCCAAEDADGNPVEVPYVILTWYAATPGEDFDVRAKSSPPFWLAERQNRSFHLSKKIGQFLEMAEAHLSQPGFDDHLAAEYYLDAYTISQLKNFLSNQRKTTGCALPHRHHLVIENTVMGAGGSSGSQIVLHTLWGGRVNRPLAMAIEAAWQKRHGSTLQIFATNDGIALLLPNDVQAEDILGLVRPHTVDDMLHQQLAQTGLFGARFRECAGRALLLPRRSLKHRMPLWLSRLKAQKLMAAVENKSDFPILVETWRTCLQDEFELPVLRQLLAELESGEIKCTHVRTSFPSPMARGGTWQQVNHHMYQSDQPASAHSGGLQTDLIEAVSLDPGLRPQIDNRLVDLFEAKCQRLANGYAPKTPEDLLAWVKERLLIPRSEWDALVEAIHAQYGLTPMQVVSPIEDKLVCMCPPSGEELQQGSAGPSRQAGQGTQLIAVRESVERLVGGLIAQRQDSGVVVRILQVESDRTGCGNVPPELITGITFTSEEMPDRYGPDPSLSHSAGLLSEWLRFYGPKTIDDICHRLGVASGQLTTAMEELRQAQVVIEGRLTTDATGPEICDRENFEILLRLSRASRAPEFQTMDIHQLPLFLAHHQGVTRTEDGNRSLMDALLPLLGWSAPAGLWESDLLPARLADYQEDWLDQAMKSGELCWLGKEGGKVLFSFEHELDLMQPDSAVRITDDEPRSDDSVVLDLDSLFIDPSGRYPFQVLQRNSGMNAARLTRGLWQAVWKSEVTNDSFTALRHGIVHRFDMPDVASLPSRRSLRRRGRMPGRLLNRQYQASLPQGNWYRIGEIQAPSNGLEREERNKERVRLLLDRYGIVFRELLARELPHLQWGSMFRSLRLMELAGEVVGGHFFSHVPGIQFIASQALEKLQLGLPSDCIFWINAADPASVCGLGLPELKTQLPRRLPGNHLVYHGSRPVIISRNFGNSLHIDVPADHPKITSYFKFLTHLLYRKIAPLRHILIERINDLPASHQSAYIDHLSDAFEVVSDPKGVVLYRRHE